jgi:hypothetical protein
MGTEIAIKPLRGDDIDCEAKASDIKLGDLIVGGVTVQAILTQCGTLPLFVDLFLPLTNAASANQSVSRPRRRTTRTIPRRTLGRDGPDAVRPQR